MPASTKRIRARIYAANLRWGGRMEKILFSKVAASVRERWFGTGASLAAIQKETQVEDFARKVRVEVRSGKSYDAFGEYGTMRRGAAAKAKHRPKSWRYGRKKGGIKARLMYLIGLQEARKDARRALQEEIRAMKRSK